MKLVKEIWGNLPFQVRVMLAAAVGIVIILALVLGGVRSCRDKRTEQKIDRIKTNAQSAGVEANVLTNQKQEVEVNANKANANLDAILDTDSSVRDTDFGTVKRKWCTEHPNDSKCK